MKTKNQSKSIKFFLSIFALLLLCTSCDPAHILIFKNVGNTDAMIVMEVDENLTYSLTLNNSVIVDNQQFVTLNPGDESDMYFGIGTWSDSEIEEQAENIKQIQVIVGDSSTIYDTKEDIIKLMKKGRKKGLLGNDFSTEIVIKVS